MTTRTASCRCGQLSITVEGEPGRVSVCHCLNCKARSGSAFAAQARWPDEKVKVSGQSKAWVNVGDSGGKATFSFCPECGSDVFFVLDVLEGVTAVPIGAFRDPTFPAPAFSVFESRKHRWVEITGEGIEHD